ncbi:hypothetical protein [Sandarakinorhabdus sp.]|uniref:hypothetical protein n=1 Tax=Sandarakinorhabdus sp. TaxID=1916663 RepID=UPI00286E4653|nr:hypothetical protein [Sandarakinorhabdus sp.]
MTDQLPIDASDWNDDDTSDGVAVPGSNTLDNLLDFFRGRLIAMVEDARDSMVGQVRGLTSLSGLLTDALGANAAPVTRVVGDYAGSINSIADALEQKSVEELVEDGRELVRAQPAAAVGIAIAIGFLAGRMLKAARD